MIARAFNAEGIAQFGAFLRTCREYPETAIPTGLLEDDRYTESLPENLVVEPRRFAQRRQAAEFFTILLSPLPDEYVMEARGLWSWLSLFYFKEVCPLRDGTRVVRNDKTYIFEPKNPRYFYRHLLFISWYVSKIAGPFDRLYVAHPVSGLDEFTRIVMERLYLTRIPCIFEVLDRLYWDPTRGKARVGIVDKKNIKPGDLRNRFPIRIRQLEKTYDLFSLNADQLMTLLGREFHQFSLNLE